MFGKFGIWEIALILVIILIVFGVGKLPQVGNAIGKGLRSFKKGQAGEDEDEEKETVTVSKMDSKKKKAAKKT
ncbi:MAG: twin-arginine translocase TatA/TatE family subunit [Dehalococcoidales bacterium]|nr:twin-arginine translocase TatA/TatE family subunit [Dehalococcoidales bacterium]